MHTPLTRTTSRWAGLATLAALTASLLAAPGAAQAGQGVPGVYWAVNVDAPIQGAGRVGTTFSNTPRGLYGPAPVVIAPPVVYAPRPVYVPQPVYVQRGHDHRRRLPHWGWRHHHDEGRHGWHHDRREAYRHGYGDGRHEGRHEGRWESHRGDRYAWGRDD
ncbi:MAG: hypothetical protein AABZ19_14440 [Pseudomonadota bacterium]